MTLKIPSKQRRSKIPLRSDYSKAFEKDWDRYSRAGRVDMARVKEAMVLLVANDGPLGAEWRDHDLKGGDWLGHRELHVGGDLLLVYKAVEGGIIFVRLGTHSELFGL